jgi:hypothetical protein
MLSLQPCGIILAWGALAQNLNNLTFVLNAITNTVQFLYKLVKELFRGLFYLYSDVGASGTAQQV